jgi:hypothetical protein
MASLFKKILKGKKKPGKKGKITKGIRRRSTLPPELKPPTKKKKTSKKKMRNTRRA